MWQALTPVRAAFSALAPVFSALGNGIKAVWEWFKNLLTPMQTSKDALDKCASAGETFGRVMGAALSVLLWPLQQLMNGVSWLLEKLDLIPDGIERAGSKPIRHRVRWRHQQPRWPVISCHLVRPPCPVLAAASRRLLPATMALFGA